MNDHFPPPVPCPGPTCAAFVDLLPLVGEETLADDEALRLHQHLPTCAYCQTQRSIYDRIAEALSRYGELPEVRPFSPEEVVQMLEDVPPTPLKPPAPFPAAKARRARRLISSFSALAAVLVIVLLTVTLQALHHAAGTPTSTKRTPPTGQSAPP